jgi:hypothetical protein
VKQKQATRFFFSPTLPADLLGTIRCETAFQQRESRKRKDKKKGNARFTAAVIRPSPCLCARAAR